MSKQPEFYDKDPEYLEIRVKVKDTPASDYAGYVYGSGWETGKAYTYRYKSFQRLIHNVVYSVRRSFLLVDKDYYKNTLGWCDAYTLVTKSVERRAPILLSSSVFLYMIPVPFFERTKEGQNQYNRWRKQMIQEAKNKLVERDFIDAI